MINSILQRFSRSFQKLNFTTRFQPLFSGKGLPLLLIMAVLTGCGPSRDLVYFSNLTPEDMNQFKPITNTVEPTIQPDDLLSITVNSLSAESNRLFNTGVVGTLGSTVSEGDAGRTPIEGYLVDKDGAINFPVVGKIQLAGLTKGEATDKITEILNTQYVKDATVHIRFLNFKITLLGEVNNPSVITIPTEKINIVEAISMAGDLTAIGKRENILIIREKDGVRNMYRVNLNDKDLLNSPQYYLQQNDIVYVEPDRLKEVQASVRRSNVQFALSTILSILTIVTIYTRFQ